jgi:hypothetical protein
MGFSFLIFTENDFIYIDRRYSFWAILIYPTLSVLDREHADNPRENCVKIVGIIIAYHRGN